MNRLSEMQVAPHYATARATLAQAEAVIAALERECTRLQLDAERYRFIRSRTITPSAAVACAEAVGELFEDEMDAAIDDAMQSNDKAQPTARQGADHDQ